MKSKTLLFFTFLLGMSSNLNAQVFFTEDFEGAMDAGTDLPATWTETGLSTDGIWQTGDETAATSGYLTWPTPVSGVNFAYTNDDACNCDKSSDRMILPTQDFTGMAAVNLTADIYVNGGYGETFSCEASTDGGATWTLVQTFTPNATLWSPAVVVDLSAFAGMSNVMISFLYSDAGSWAYGAGVDNLSLAQTVTTTDLTPLTHNGQYTIIPETQTAPMTLSADIFNNSSSDLTDVIVNANVFLDGNLDQNFTSAAASILAGDTLEVTAGVYTPVAVGAYSVEFIVSSASLTDSNPNNDTLYYDFVVDPSTYARDNGINVIALGVNGTGNTSVIGTLFEINNATRMDSLLAAHGGLLAGDTLIYEIYETALNAPTTMIGISDIYIVTAADETAGAAVPTVAVMDLATNDLFLNPGTYFVGYRELTTINNGGLMMTDDIFTENTVYASIDGGPWLTMESIGFANTPIVRPILASCTNFSATVTSTDISCNGLVDGTGTISASGVPGYTYQWDAAAGNQTTATVTGLGAGVYYVTVTDTIGCSVTDSVTIVEPAVLVVNTIDNGDGTATATATGGTAPYTYAWDAAAGNQTTATAIDLATGSYTVTITDVNGCTTTSTIAVVSNVGIDELASEMNVFMHPNPASDVVYINVFDTDAMPELNVRIFNTTGQLVVELTNESTTNGLIEINTSELPSGFYTLQLNGGDLESNKRLVIVQ